MITFLVGLPNGSPFVPSPLSRNNITKNRLSLCVIILSLIFNLLKKEWLQLSHNIELSYYYLFLFE